jgi:hypothetical protein
LLRTLRRNYPALSKYPDYYLLRQSTGSLAKANAEMEGRDGRGCRHSLEARLAKNYKGLLGKRTYLEAGHDDRHKELHPGRFMPGPLCTIADYWLAAKRSMPERGYDPLSHYDSKGAGFHHIIAAKAWATAHDPGATDITLGMFTQEAGTMGNSDSSFRHCMPENLAAFKIVLSTARGVLQLVQPWNLSIMMLQLFLENNEYGYKYFTNAKEHVKSLMAFGDRILLMNAKNWQMDKPCLDAPAITQQWAQFTAGRPSDNRSRPSDGERHPNGSGHSGGRDPRKRRRTRSRSRKGRRDYPALKEGALCGRFNDGSCRNADGKCIVRGYSLRHRCSFLQTNGEACEERHPRIDHK